MVSKHSSSLSLNRQTGSQGLLCEDACRKGILSVHVLSNVLERSGRTTSLITCVLQYAASSSTTMLPPTPLSVCAFVHAHVSV